MLPPQPVINLCFLNSFKLLLLLLGSNSFFPPFGINYLVERIDRWIWYPFPLRKDICDLKYSILSKKSPNWPNLDLSKKSPNWPNLSHLIGPILICRMIKFVLNFLYYFFLSWFCFFFCGVPCVVSWFCWDFIDIANQPGLAVDFFLFLI